VLSVPKIKLDNTLYNAVLNLSNSDPVKFVIRSVEEADQNMSLEKSMDLNYEFAVASENPWNYRLVSNLEFPSRSGAISELFELRPGDCNADCGRNYERAEVSETGNTRAVEGDELWYAWSFYVPEDYNDDKFQYGASSWVNITQFHQSPNYDPAWIFSKKYGGDFVIRRFPTRWFTIPYREYIVLPKEEYTGRWNDILVHVKWTTSASGFMKIWANDELVLDYKGFTRTPENNNVYFKYGLYRKAGPPSALNIYFDEVKRAASRDGVR
jgi:hypothetical protein